MNKFDFGYHFFISSFLALRINQISCSKFSKAKLRIFLNRKRSNESYVEISCFDDVCFSCFLNCESPTFSLLNLPILKLVKEVQIVINMRILFTTHVIFLFNKASLLSSCPTHYSVVLNITCGH